ncbi:MAG: AAA family ATPase [Candidatus Methanomethylophilaceae archaeon]|nr:AAA family ATPase [Candidatus Methanomethylophilaceae archaeon]
MVRPLPIGVQDFKEVRDEGYLYVDKSDLIPQILSQKSKVYLYTRPRRFGKSLNLSMLDAFFNIKYPKDNTWFDGLKVSDCRECDEHRNAYPVIMFDFKNIRSDNNDVLLRSLKTQLSYLLSEFKYLLGSDRVDDTLKNRFKSLSTSIDEIELTDSLNLLSRMLYAHHGKKVIVLIDEYDNPIHNAFGKPHHQEILDSMRDILSSALKGNDSLQFGVVTGVMQISKESIFSGLNNLKVNNVLSKDFDEMFGFTDEEVKSILEEYSHPERIDEAREWYDGYRFGDANVYNPWSLLNYVDERFEPKPYWAGTSGNSILEDLFKNASPELWDEFRSLSEGMSIPYKVKPTITFQDLHTDERNVYSMLVMSGYLTAEVHDDGKSSIHIPNGEMANVFGSYILDRLNIDSPMYVNSLSKAFVKGDINRIESELYDLFASSAGNAMLNDEHSYQAFVTGMLMYLNGRYTVKADLEEGNGRYDIRLVRRYGDYPNIVIEIKRIPIDSSDEAAETSAKKALEQIKERDYTHGLEGPTLLYGIAFRNKKPTVLSERMDI